MRGCARRLNADGAAVEPVGQAASGDEAVERSGDMVGKAAEQGHVSGLSWIESIDARPIAAWAARKALHRLRAAGSNDMAGPGAPPPLPTLRGVILAGPAVASRPPAVPTPGPWPPPRARPGDAVAVPPHRPPPPRSALRA